MASPEALAVIAETEALRRSHAHAPALDTLDLVMKRRAGQALNFLQLGAPHGSLGPRMLEADRRRERYELALRAFL